ncbi:MAG TPA: DUF488 domain-containing protein [Pirellulales bacterium]|nr:DUF488 domain-containing protein [Pirellulales bacterium]
MPREIWTIGHSNRSFDEFVELLHGESIQQLADVRRFPGSRAHPHFNLDALEAGLAQARIGYRHFGPLGGRRSQRPADSPNGGWRVDSFNRYADYMATREFAAALEDLIAFADERRTAIMCSEAVPWRCHRRLIADALIVRGWQVFDIIHRGAAKPHAMTPFARVDHGRITYPAEPEPTPLFDPPSANAKKR